MIPGTTYVYVDGENHFIRVAARLRERFGKTIDLSRVRTGRDHDRGELFVNPDCSFLWDGQILPTYAAPAMRRVYVSAYSGEHEQHDHLCEWVRNKGFEPVLAKEEKRRRDGRRNDLEQLKLIEKPKGVDITLAVRVIEDALAGNYQHRALFTTDADFLPVIRAVRRLGKTVHVYGFKADAKPELRYTPDEFVDLDSFIKHYAYDSPTPK